MVRKKSRVSQKRKYKYGYPSSKKKGSRKMETVLPTYTETFTDQEGKQGLIVDSGTVDGEDWKICMVDDDNQSQDDKSEDFSDKGSDDVMLLDVEQLYEEDYYEVETIEIVDNETGGNVNKTVENDNICSNKPQMAAFAIDESYNKGESLDEGQTLKISDEGQSLKISDEMCNTVVQQDDQCESDNGETTNNVTMDIEMSCDTIVPYEHNMENSQDNNLLSDTITDSMDRHTICNIKLEPCDSEKDFDISYISEENNCINFQEPQVNTGTLLQMSEVNWFGFDTCTPGSSSIGGDGGNSSGADLFDIGMLPFLLESQEQENHEQSVLDQREKKGKQNSSKKKVPLISSGCCAGCDTMMNIGTRRRKNHQCRPYSVIKDVVAQLCDVLVEIHMDFPKVLLLPIQGLPLNQKKKGTVMKVQKKRAEFGRNNYNLYKQKKPTELSRKHYHQYMNYSLHMKFTDKMIGQFCLECKAAITSHDHFRKLPHCDRCGFRTNCNRAYADHMIIKHGHIRPNYENINIEFSSGFMECFCGIVHLDGNKMANHLVACEYGHMACIATKLGPLRTSLGRRYSTKLTAKRQQNISYTSKQHSQKQNFIKTSAGNRINPTGNRTKYNRRNYSHRTSSNVGGSVKGIADRKQQRLVKLIMFFHSYSMPPWLKPLSGNENLKTIYDQFKPSDNSSASWKHFISAMNTIVTETDPSSKLIFNVGNEKMGALHDKEPVQGGSQQESEINSSFDVQNDLDEIDEQNDFEEVDILNYDSESAEMNYNNLKKLGLEENNGKTKKRSSKHNTLERNRRHQMKRLFYDLYDVLPKYKINREMPSKKSILGESVKLIESLKDGLKQLELQKEWLFQQQMVLKDTFQQMKDSITM